MSQKLLIFLTISVTIAISVLNLHVVHLKLSCVGEHSYEMDIRHHDLRLKELKGEKFYKDHLKRVTESRIEMCRNYYEFSYRFRKVLYEPTEQWKD